MPPENVYSHCIAHLQCSRFSSRPTSPNGLPPRRVSGGGRTAAKTSPGVYKPPRLARLLGGRGQAAQQPAAGVGRVDHGIDLQRGGHVHGLAVGVLLVDQALEQGLALGPGGRGLQLFAKTHARRASRTSYTRRRFSGTAWRSRRGSGACHWASGPWKYDRYWRAAATASASSRTSTSITPLADCTSLGPICSGLNTPRPPPSIMAGPLMPMLLASVAMITSAQPSKAALPAKQRPCTMPTTGTWPDRAAKRLKVWLLRPATMGMSVSPGRPPPPSANSTTGRRSWCASASMRSVLWWLRMPWVPASTV